jgi:hypothetical protein
MYLFLNTGDPFNIRISIASVARIQLVGNEQALTFIQTKALYRKVQPLSYFPRCIKFFTPGRIS